MPTDSDAEQQDYALIESHGPVSSYLNLLVPVSCTCYLEVPIRASACQLRFAIHDLAAAVNQCPEVYIRSEVGICCSCSGLHAVPGKRSLCFQCRRCRIGVESCCQANCSPNYSIEPRRHLHGGPLEQPGFVSTEETALHEKVAACHCNSGASVTSCTSRPGGSNPAPRSSKWLASAF